MAQTYAKLLYHIVFSTKNRLPLVQKAFREELYRYMGGIVAAKGGKVLESGGIEDHVHLLTQIPASIAVADLVRTVKANSSKWLNESKFRVRKFGWQDGYAAFTVSQSQASRVARRRVHSRTGATPPQSGLSIGIDFTAQTASCGV